MKKKILQDALNQVDEKWANEYARIAEKDGKYRKNRRWIGPLAIAACLMLVLGVAAINGHFNRINAPSGSLETPTASSKQSPGSSVSAEVTRPAPTWSSQNNTPLGSLPADGLASEDQAGMASADTYYQYKTRWDGFGREENWNTEEYNYLPENGFLSVKTSPFSTFAADVDTASYANLRRMIRNGQTIPADAVRIEELINYFHYDYEEPKEGEPFGVTMELADCPWNDQAKLLLIGLQAKKLDAQALPPSNLVFLIDVSGSMASPNKLALAQRSFMTLAESLSAKDRVTIITYSSGEKLVLDGVSGDQTARIMGALEELQAGGSTNGQQALKMAYEAAKKHCIPGGNNRIILATDGDFNVGITSEAELTRFVKEEAKSGIYLSVLGYGMGNYKDNKMEAMADNGNGNYYYIDDIAEARKVLVEEAGGTLFTVAKDVKLQVEFNPALVKGYRLIGYENRVMAAEDFADDTKDGGEIGAGHQVTALYEIIPVGADFEIPEVESKYQDTTPGGSFSDEWLTLNIRYKEPEGDISTLLTYPLTRNAYRAKASYNLSWAAGLAQWGMLLRDSEYKGSSDYDSLIRQMEKLAEDDFRRECVELIRQTAR